MQNTEDKHVATLVLPEEYERHVDQVASISTHWLLFIKRKRLALQPFKLLEFPLHDCSAIAYKTRIAIFSMLWGLIMLVLAGLIFYGVYAYGDRALENRAFPIGAVLVMLFFSFKLLRYPQRHCLTFVINGKKLNWQSRAGDFKRKTLEVEKIIQFARNKGLLKDSSN